MVGFHGPILVVVHIISTSLLLSRTESHGHNLSISEAGKHGLVLCLGRRDVHGFG